jgi:hypothetical protein
MDLVILNPAKIPKLEGYTKLFRTKYSIFVHMNLRYLNEA